MGVVRQKGRLAQGANIPNSWGMGRRMSELCGAVAWAQLKKLPVILSHMRESKRRIKEGLKGIPGLAFRRMNDAEGDTGAFLVLMLPDESRAVKALGVMREKGLFNAARVSEYGQHIYYNIPSLVQKIPLSAAGNPWSLEQNRPGNYDYRKGACPRSDGLFARSLILPVPSKLTRAQEKGAVKIIREAVGA
jgi:dTDP-4-amino-4,6-dideoxygalactose transaminase